MLNRRRGLRWAVVAVAMALAVFAAAPGMSLALDCEGRAIDGGCLFTNADGVPMWDFVRDKDLQAIGYPISQRWGEGPFTLQAFQKVILQWDPVAVRMNYYNTLDVLADVYPHVELPNVPAHQVLAADLGADFGMVIRNHLAILEQNAKIKERFLAEPDWLNLYGLPVRYEAREVEGNPEGLQVLRTQRTVFEVWNAPAPGTSVGALNLQNVPDKVKRLSNVIIPDAAEAPVTVCDVPGLPRFTLTTIESAPTAAHTSDREALVALYNATGGANWENNNNWLSEAPIGRWHGVTTDRSGRVTELHLDQNELSGEIPVVLGCLSSLRELILSRNELRGTIPAELGSLSRLKRLWLGGNELSGKIPAELGSLSDLVGLGLSDNQLSGEIPGQLGSLSRLKWLWLGSNELSGEIPMALGSLSNLEELDLALRKL